MYKALDLGHRVGNDCQDKRAGTCKDQHCVCVGTRCWHNPRSNQRPATTRPDQFLFLHPISATKQFVSHVSIFSHRFKDSTEVTFVQYQEHTDRYKEKQRFLQESGNILSEVVDESGFLSAVGARNHFNDDGLPGTLSLTSLFDKAIQCLRLDLPSVPIGLWELFPNMLYYRDSEQYCLFMYALQFSCVPFVQFVMQQNYNTLRLLLQQIEEPILHFAIKNE